MCTYKEADLEGGGGKWCMILGVTEKNQLNKVCLSMPPPPSPIERILNVCFQTVT